MAKKSKKSKKAQFKTPAKIKVVGVGGAGGNAITRMFNAGTFGVELIAINTDLQDLAHVRCSNKLHIGKNVTRGLGAGMNPELGKLSAEENKEEIKEMLRGADMIFVTAGLGGGTGTGAAPVILDLAREVGSLGIAVVTRPFSFEGFQRIRIADDGLIKIKEKADSLITIANDRVLQIIDKKTTLFRTFAIIDEILKQAVLGISDLIIQPGIINVDFADVKAIMQNSGPALLGVGRASGINRAQEAARLAITSPLLDISIHGARGLLFNVAGGRDLTMMEIHEAAKFITSSIDPDAKIIFGASFDKNLNRQEVKITVVATGFANQLFKRSDLSFLNEPAKRFDSLSVFNKPTKAENDFNEANKLKKPIKVISVQEPDELIKEWETPTYLRKKKK